jgi:hypothetical protein
MRPRFLGPARLSRASRRFSEYWRMGDWSPVVVVHNLAATDDGFLEAGDSTSPRPASSVSVAFSVRPNGNSPI